MAEAARVLPAANAPIPPPRRRRMVYGTLTAAAGLVLVGLWVLFRPEPAAPLTFHVAPFRIHSRDCALDDAGRRYLAALIAALGRVRGSRIVIAPPEAGPPDPAGGAYLVGVDLDCSQTGLRSTVTLTSPGDFGVTWVGRFDVPGGSEIVFPEGLVAEMTESLGI